LPAFVFYCDFTIQREKKIQKVDIPFQEWPNDEEAEIYIRKQHAVNDKFFELLCDGHVYIIGIF
jgi:hypothetical protein